MCGFCRSRWAKVSTPVSGLLISWATPAARRPIEASFSARLTCCRAACVSCVSRRATASAMASMAWHRTPNSPGGRMPTRAVMSPEITFRDMATIRPTGRITSIVTV